MIHPMHLQPNPQALAVMFRAFEDKVGNPNTPGRAVCAACVHGALTHHPRGTGTRLGRAWAFQWA